jgi:hypothetical protein
VRENRMPLDDIGIEKELDAAQSLSARCRATYTPSPGVLHRYRDAAAVRAVRERQLERIDLVTEYDAVPVIVPPPADSGVFTPTPLSYTAVSRRAELRLRGILAQNSWILWE